MSETTQYPMFGQGHKKGYLLHKPPSTYDFGIIKVHMTNEGLGPTYCSQKRSVWVKKKGLILSSNYLDQRRIAFIWFLLLRLEMGYIE